MPNDQPWRDFAKHSNDELVDEANEALLRSDDLCLKRIELEMWRRQANTGENALEQATRASLLTMVIAVIALALGLTPLFGFNTLTGQVIWGIVLAGAAITMARIWVDDWRRARHVRKRRWPRRK